MLFSGDLDFADDVVLLADSWIVMAALVKKMKQVMQRFGIRIGAEKSVILYIGRGEIDVRVEDVRPRGQAMRAVDVFTYLGSVMASSGKFTQVVDRRRAGATRAVGMFTCRLCGRKEISVKVKMKIFNVTCADVWRNCVGADENRGKETGFI